MMNRLKGKPRCPSCDTIIDGFASARHPDAKPKNGDVSICATCGQLLVFIRDAFEALPPETYETLPEGIKKELGMLQALLKKGGFLRSTNH